MIAVGIDVSKSKSTVAILNGDGTIRAKPFDVHHVAGELHAFGRLHQKDVRTSNHPYGAYQPLSLSTPESLSGSRSSSLSDQSLSDEEVWRYRASESKDRQKRCFADCSVCT